MKSLPGHGIWSTQPKHEEDRVRTYLTIVMSFELVVSGQPSRYAYCMQLFFPELPNIASPPSSPPLPPRRVVIILKSLITPLSPLLSQRPTAATAMPEIWRETEARAAVEIEDGEKERHDSRERFRGDKQTEVRD